MPACGLIAKVLGFGHLQQDGTSSQTMQGLECEGLSASCMPQAAGEGDDVEDSGAEDGVYLFRPHTQYISGLR